MTGAEFNLDLERLDATVQSAIREGEPDGLRVLGYGEITLVLGWPTLDPTVAVKRLPQFRDKAQLQRYAALVDEYAAELEAAGVGVVPTAVRWVTARDGEPHAYLLQPLVPAARQLNHVLRDADERQGAALLERLVDCVVGAVGERIGLDAQAANWAIVGDRLALFDISTPIIRSERGGRQRLELDPFISIYPWALRGVLRPIARSIMNGYHDPRAVLLDVASNLHKEELGRWIPVLLSFANPRLSEEISERQVQRYFARDRRLWLGLQRLRRADRAWQRRVRHRPYPFLLPPPYRYGPA